MRRGQGTSTGLRRCHTSRPPRPRPPANLRAGARGRGAKGGCCARARTASASAGASASASCALMCVDHHVALAATTAPYASCSALGVGGEPRPAPRAPPTPASPSWPRSTRGATVLKEQQEAVPASRATFSISSEHGCVTANFANARRRTETKHRVDRLQFNSTSACSPPRHRRQRRPVRSQKKPAYSPPTRGMCVAGRWQLRQSPAPRFLCFHVRFAPQRTHKPKPRSLTQQAPPCVLLLCVVRSRQHTNHKQGG